MAMVDVGAVCGDGRWRSGAGGYRGRCIVTKRTMAMGIVGLAVFDLAMLALIVALWEMC